MPVADGLAGTSAAITASTSSTSMSGLCIEKVPSRRSMLVTVPDPFSAVAPELSARRSTLKVSPASAPSRSSRSCLAAPDDHDVVEDDLADRADREAVRRRRAPPRSLQASGGRRTASRIARSLTARGPAGPQAHRSTDRPASACHSGRAPPRPPHAGRTGPAPRPRQRFRPRSASARRRRSPVRASLLRAGTTARAPTRP